jgi:hypothetical protein
MNNLRVIGKNIKLSIAEKEWLGVMMRQFGCTEQEALDEIIVYKREMAFYHEKKGNLELARHLLQEIDEWDDTREAEFVEFKEKEKEISLVLPEGFDLK